MEFFKKLLGTNKRLNAADEALKGDPTINPPVDPSPTPTPEDPDKLSQEDINKLMLIMNRKYSLPTKDLEFSNRIAALNSIINRNRV